MLITRPGTHARAGPLGERRSQSRSAGLPRFFAAISVLKYRGIAHSSENGVHHIVHHTDRDGWGSAALLVSQHGPAACRLYPCDGSDTLAVINGVRATEGDMLWVLDLPAPAVGWAGLRQDSPIRWVDHHRASWTNPAPAQIEAILPSGVRSTTTMHLLIERGLVRGPNLMAFVRSLCVPQFESDWARVFDGLERNAADDVLRSSNLPFLLAGAPGGATVPDALQPALRTARKLSDTVADLLRNSLIEETPGLVVAYIADTRGTKVKRFSLALRDAHPGALIVVVHHSTSLYCARNSRTTGPDLLQFFREHQLNAVGHPYVCSVIDAPRDRLTHVLTDLRDSLHTNREGHERSGFAE
jgi:hypothetical protein